MAIKRESAADIIGRRYGHLEVLDVITRHTQKGAPVRKAVCKCDCGAVKEVYLQLLRNGQQSCSRSCKYNTTNRDYEDVIGKKYGVLTIKGVTYKIIRGKHTTFAICSCACGREATININKVISGLQSCCGRECKFYKANVKLSAEGVIGKRYGHLVATEVYRTKKGREGDTRVRCICDCGNTCDIPAHRWGHQKYCGLNCYYYHSGYSEPPANYVEGTDLTMLHSKPTKANRSGVVGVHKETATGKWVANIVFKGQQIRLGRYHLKKEAIKARQQAEKLYFEPILKKYGKL